jgi:hypothetical protein
MVRKDFILEQLQITRAYTLELLKDTPADWWFTLPPAGVSHIGWQVGHLAMAEYRLLLDRMRPSTPADDALISPDFLKLFGKGSIPTPDPSLYPSPDSLLATLANVHEASLAQLNSMSDQDLDQPVLKPHMFVKTKYESGAWCSRHEMLHVGQIGLLRRQLGAAPTR